MIRRLEPARAAGRIIVMPTDAENRADPNMVLVEIRGQREWVARSDLSHTGSPFVGSVKFQGMTFTKNRSLTRTFDDPEFIASLGGGPDGGSDSPKPAPPRQLQPLAQTVDLNDLGAQMAQSWVVDLWTRLSIQAVLASGTWDTAKVQVRGSLDNENWTVIRTLTGVGFSPGIDITDYIHIQITDSVVEGGVGVGRFCGYATNFP